MKPTIQSLLLFMLILTTVIGTASACALIETYRSKTQAWAYFAFAMLTFAAIFAYIVIN